jgi:hypothetical protein
MALTPNLLPILNQTALQQSSPRLYQVLQELIKNLGTSEKTIATVSSLIISSGFVTSTIGGTPDTLAMFTAIRNIENVTDVGISAALDLLP